MKKRSIKYLAKRIPEKIRQKIQVMKNTLVIYVWSNKVNEPPKKDSDIDFIVFDRNEDYTDFFESHKFNKNKDASDRFAFGAFYCALTINDEIVSSGWYVEKHNKFPLAEINRFIQIPFGVCFLFDYVTEERYRGRGYYVILLNQIQCKLNDKTLFIYTLNSNNASRKGIENAGFRELGHFKHSSKDFRRVMSDYNIVVVKNRII